MAGWALWLGVMGSVASIISLAVSGLTLWRVATIQLVQQIPVLRTTCLRLRSKVFSTLDIETSKSSQALVALEADVRGLVRSLRRVGLHHRQTLGAPIREIERASEQLARLRAGRPTDVAGVAGSLYIQCSAIDLELQSISGIAQLGEGE